MKRFKRHLYSIASVLTLAFSIAFPPMLQHAAAQTPADEVCAGIATASGAGCNGSDTSLNNVVANGINILSVVIGIAAVIMIMVAGFKMITAQGDSGSISSAKNTLMYAIIGLVIVALAQGIVHFVLHAATTPPSATTGPRH
ncbi:MAG TPA: pilin [Candidatus Saccharimonadales bacterium]|nr:pilin [Candidatus Saccharimonadales bacterium]